MKEYKFLRQYSVGPYILDFFCVALQLGIEVDGQFHGDKDHRTYDRLRSDFLVNNGITVIRFWNAEVIKDLNSVKIKIEKEISTIEHSLHFKKSPFNEGEI